MRHAAREAMPCPAVDDSEAGPRDRRVSWDVKMSDREKGNERGSEAWPRDRRVSWDTELLDEIEENAIAASGVQARVSQLWHRFKNGSVSQNCLFSWAEMLDHVFCRMSGACPTWRTCTWQLCLAACA